ncbi:hypothetical protein [Pseudomonas matsuisoli]|uniref:Uncharacterized protein n=1 Tax=Pseudomonas matsuisoli TaxID=1515666 RepID=A0A917PNW2_9PSED|nr:hypothetical protein [Pseudomonas matsuisoli]GGJ86500.1 hypothetical protein GCM10009304_10640 [Pseudomonas matsuisoli]
MIAPLLKHDTYDIDPESGLMKIKSRIEMETVTDVLCDVCRQSTKVKEGALQFASLLAHWGYGAKHDGERYEFHLCESCFFQAIAYLKQERRTACLFDEDQERVDDRFGLVATDDFFGDSVRK